MVLLAATFAALFIASSALLGYKTAELRNVKRMAEAMLTDANLAMAAATIELELRYADR